VRDRFGRGRVGDLIVGLRTPRSHAELQTALAHALHDPTVEVGYWMPEKRRYTSRSRLVAARDNERRRLERDLHDGAQQRLVTLSLALGAARSQLGEPADTAAAALARTSPSSMCACPRRTATTACAPRCTFVPSIRRRGS